MPKEPVEHAAAIADSAAKADDTKDFATLEGLSLWPKAKTFLADRDIATAFPAQATAIPAILAGRSGVIFSPTGSGKTLAYLLPLLQRLAEEPKKRAVVIAPSTELAMQILSVARDLKPEGMKVGAAVASSARGRNATSLTQSTQLVVGTPGRIAELYKARKLKGVWYLVLDEPDPILAMKESDYLVEVMGRPEPPLQIILASATLGLKAKGVIAKRLPEDAFRAQAKGAGAKPAIEHYTLAIRGGQAKDMRLAAFMRQQRCRQALIFVNRAEQLGHLFRFFNDQGFATQSLSANRSKAEREQSMQAFRKGKVKVLLTTDRAFRGMDIPALDWVFHYEPPHSAAAFAHRSGRVGRAGKKGRSVALVTDDERAIYKRYARELGLRFSPSAGLGKKATKEG